MAYEWDNEKNDINYRKHGIYFEEAQTVWADEFAAEFADDGHEGDEERFLKLGRSTRMRVVLVVFCERHENIVRIISARKATKKELEFYEKRI